MAFQSQTTTARRKNAPNSFSAELARVHRFRFTLQASLCSSIQQPPADSWPRTTTTPSCTINKCSTRNGAWIEGHSKRERIAAAERCTQCSSGILLVFHCWFLFWRLTQQWRKWRYFPIQRLLYCYHHRLWSNGYILNGEPTKRCSIRTNVGQEWWRLLEQKWNMACDWLAVLKCCYRGL